MSLKSKMKMIGGAMAVSDSDIRGAEPVEAERRFFVRAWPSLVVVIVLTLWGVVLVEGAHAQSLNYSPRYLEPHAHTHSDVHAHDHAREHDHTSQLPRLFLSRVAELFYPRDVMRLGFSTDEQPEPGQESPTPPDLIPPQQPQQARPATPQPEPLTIYARDLSGHPSDMSHAWPQITLWPIVVDASPPSEGLLAEAQGRVSLTQEAAGYITRATGGAIQFQVSAASYAQVEPGAWQDSCDPGPSWSALSHLAQRGEMLNGRIPVFFMLNPEKCRNKGWAHPMRGIDVARSAPHLGVFIHELGHVLGLGHASKVPCEAFADLQSCRWGEIISEYGDGTDIMGYGAAESSYNGGRLFGPMALSKLGVDKRVRVQEGIDRVVRLPAYRPNTTPETLMIPLPDGLTLYLQARHDEWEEELVLIPQVGASATPGSEVGGESWSGDLGRTLAPSTPLVGGEKPVYGALSITAGERLTYGDRLVVYFEHEVGMPRLQSSLEGSVGRGVAGKAPAAIVRVVWQPRPAPKVTKVKVKKLPRGKRSITITLDQEIKSGEVRLLSRREWGDRVFRYRVMHKRERGIPARRSVRIVLPKKYRTLRKLELLDYAGQRVRITLPRNPS